MTATAVVNEAPTPVSAWQTMAGTTIGDDPLDRLPACRKGATLTSMTSALNELAWRRDDK
jgi:hypothetical protein